MTEKRQKLAREEVVSTVKTELERHAIADFHTHLYAPSFGANASGLMLFGIDELLTYHYVVAELFRAAPIAPEKFWSLGKVEQADLVWRHLFVERSPVSEACRGVLTVLHALGLDASPGALPSIRRFFAEQDPDRHVDRVMQLANVRSITMTNDVFDDAERGLWLARPDVGKDPRFRAVLRIDPLLVSYPDAARKLNELGYRVGDARDARTVEEARRFLREWIERIGAIYVAVSLPPEFRFRGDDDDPGQAMLKNVVVPVCMERGLPFAMMIGARRGVNPALRQAGDGLGKADVDSVATICRSFPQAKFFVTMLSRENQHELCVAARKFSNLMLFGCWWFMNVPSLIEEITRMRLELLGTSFVPQHSDARVLDQLVYKWDHSRRVIGDVLADKYVDLVDTEWPVTAADVRRDVAQLFQHNVESFLSR